MKTILILVSVIMNLYSNALSFNKEKYLIYRDVAISNSSFENTMLTHYFLTNNSVLPLLDDNIGYIEYIVDGYSPSECYYPIYKFKNDYFIKNVYCKKLSINMNTKERDFLLTKSNCNVNLKMYKEDNLFELCKDDEIENISLNKSKQTFINIGNLKCGLEYDNSDKMFTNFNFLKCNYINKKESTLTFSQKTQLYKTPSEETITKMYLIAGDKADLLEEKIGEKGVKWYNILYHGKKDINAWIKADSNINLDSENK